MSSKTGRPRMHSAAWRISLWATLAYAFGTMLVFVFLHRFVAADIQRRSDAWLSGEVEVLGDVAEHTPKDALYGRVMGEVAELASKEVPNRVRGKSTANDSVFFLQMGTNGAMQLWAGPGSSEPFVAAIQNAKILPDRPTDVDVAGTAIPFRVATLRIDDGSRVHLGLSERDELRVLDKLRLKFISWWLLLVLLGFGIVFYTTRRMPRARDYGGGLAHRPLGAERTRADERAQRRGGAAGAHYQPHAGPDREFDASTAHNHGLARARFAQPADGDSGKVGDVTFCGGAWGADRAHCFSD